MIIDLLLKYERPGHLDLLDFLRNLGYNLKDQVTLKEGYEFYQPASDSHFLNCYFSLINGIDVNYLVSALKKMTQTRLMSKTLKINTKVRGRSLPRLCDGGELIVYLDVEISYK